MAAVPTRGADGIEYRSRLEDRWAAFFRQIGWRYTYEPFDGDGYIPDFVIHGANPLVVEIKPAAVLSEYSSPLDKIESGLSGKWQHDIAVLGVTPLPILSSDDIGWDYRSNPTAGMLGQHVTNGTWDWGPARWHRCIKCSEIALHHQHMSWRGRPCGCYDGAHYIGHLLPRDAQRAWAEACNHTKWNP